MKTILGLRKRLGFARSGRLGTLAADSEYVECISYNCKFHNIKDEQLDTITH